MGSYSSVVGDALCPTFTCIQDSVKTPTINNMERLGGSHGRGQGAGVRAIQPALLYNTLITYLNFAQQILYYPVSQKNCGPELWR